IPPCVGRRRRNNVAVKKCCYGWHSERQGGGKRRTRLGRMYAGAASHTAKPPATRNRRLCLLPVLCSLERIHCPGVELWSVAKRRSQVRPRSIRPRTLAFEGLCGHRHGLISAATTPAAWRYSPRSAALRRV